MSLDRIMQKKFDELKTQLKNEGHSNVVIRGTLTYAKLLARGVVMAKGFGFLTNNSTDPDQAEKMSKAMLDELAMMVLVAMTNYQKSHNLSDEDEKFILERGKIINDQMTEFFDQEKKKDGQEKNKDPEKTLEDIIEGFMDTLGKIKGVHVIKI